MAAPWRGDTAANSTCPTRLRRIAPAHITQGSKVTYRRDPESPCRDTPAASCSTRISACAVASPVHSTALAATATSTSSTTRAAPTGTSPTSPAIVAASRAARIAEDASHPGRSGDTPASPRPSAHANGTTDDDNDDNNDGDDGDGDGGGGGGGDGDEDEDEDEDEDDWAMSTRPRRRRRRPSSTCTCTLTGGFEGIPRPSQSQGTVWRRRRVPRSSSPTGRRRYIRGGGAKAQGKAKASESRLEFGLVDRFVHPPITIIITIRKYNKKKQKHTQTKKETRRRRDNKKKKKSKVGRDNKS